MCLSLSRSLVLLFAGILGSCGSDSPGMDPAPERRVEGLAQLGVFASDTRGQIRALDAALREIGRGGPIVLSDVDHYAAETPGDGSFLAVEFTGRYFDEGVGAQAAFPVTLRALVPVEQNSAPQRINANVLTTLISERIAVLARAGANGASAVAASERELHAVFHFAELACDPVALHSLDQTSMEAGSAYALRVSLIVRRVASVRAQPLSDMLSAFVTDFSDNGSIDDSVLRAALAAANRTIDYAAASSALVASYAEAGRVIQVAPVAACARPPPIPAPLADVIATVGEAVPFSATSGGGAPGALLSYHWTVRREQSDRPYFPTPPFDVFEFDGPLLDFRVDRAGSWQVRLAVTDEFGSMGVSAARLVGRHTFIVNSDGTATNRQTGLVWQLQDDGNLYTLAEARGIPVLSAGDNHGLDVCGTLSLAGFSDWRVPTLPEVASTLDFSRAPFPMAEELAPYTRDNAFYISNSWVPNSKADYIYTHDGLIQHRDAAERHWVRCVRP